ncbi:CobW family GTP-binding protein [Streptomyces winkii]|uniref:CobW family GTP-binding protein n=1 Tax=Streptomyces winkii TaxID=3051178 RepID=UPI0028D674DF|nr:GTP-binding protein [Streptomyces sp. DSM 40971]
MERPRRVPVIVLAGFLGSGKTTLLNYLLRHSGGTRIGAIVNDFGSIEIDAMTVAGQADSTVPLGDGCLCCAVDTSDMDEVLERLARPSAAMDVIIVEASGLAEPETLIRMILASGSEHAVYGGLVEVVDGAEFESVRERHPELERHVRAADLVVLGKADRVAEPELRRLRETLEAIGPGTPVVTASHGRIDPALLFDPAHRPRPPVEQLSFDALLRESAEDDEGEDADHSGHLHAAYESVEFTSRTALDPRRFLDFLDGRPPGLYRIKGFVDFGDADPVNSYAVHAVGRFLRFTPSHRRADQPDEPDEGVPTQLVLIGAGIDAAALRKELAACVADPSEAPDPHAMWGVLRYVETGADADADFDAGDPYSEGDGPDDPDPDDHPDLDAQVPADDRGFT